MNKPLLAAAVGLLGITVVGISPAGQADATPSDKVMICHATASATNPYTTPTVNTSSIDELNNQYLNGHGDHVNDIIPPFESPEGTVFDGQNWDAEGEAIWNSDCVVPSPPVQPPVNPPVNPPANPPVTPPTAVVPPQVDAQGPVPPAPETPATVGEAAAAVPAALPTTGTSSWLIFLVGLASVVTGAGFVALSRRTT